MKKKAKDKPKKVGAKNLSPVHKKAKKPTISQRVAALEAKAGIAGPAGKEGPRGETGKQGERGEKGRFWG